MFIDQHACILYLLRGMADAAALPITNPFASRTNPLASTKDKTTMPGSKASATKKAAGPTKSPAKSSRTTASGSRRSAESVATKAVAKAAPTKATSKKPPTAASRKGKPRWERSQVTRAQILDATIDCFVEIGYVRTTTTEIAKKAGFTRGAVQYYFPTTPHVLEASVKYLTEQWLEQYMEAAANAPPGADYIDYAVDTLWRFVNDRLFIAWQELTAVSRTDPELRKIIRPAAVRFEKLRREMGRETFRDFHDASVETFQRNRDTLRFVLEGMSNTMITYDKKARIEAQLTWLKAWLHESWEKELGSNPGMKAD